MATTKTKRTQRKLMLSTLEQPRHAFRFLNVSVIGTGYVGLVTGACFAEAGHKVMCVDHDEKKIAALQNGEIPIYEPGLAELIARNIAKKRLSFSLSVTEGVAHGEIIFIAVHTPPRSDGSSDMQFIDRVARQIAGALDSQYKIIADKSTVPVQTGEQVARTIRAYAHHDADFDVISNPEFMREGSAVADQMNPDRIVVGIGRDKNLKPAKKSKSSVAYPLANRLFKKLNLLYSPWIARGIPFLVTDIASAELIKHAANSFLALKISYANALSVICELAGADVTQVADGVGFDKRIGRSFLNAGIGYGGSCFPKDLAGFHHIARELGYDFKLLEEVQRINDDALARFVKKIRSALWQLGEKTIAILGLAFKPNTDDLRNAPALALIAALQKEGAQIRAYDPKAMIKARSYLPNVTFCKDTYDAADKADALVIATEWDEFRTLDLKKLKAQMRQPLLLDGRNLLDPAAVRAAGFTYHSVGR